MKYKILLIFFSFSILASCGYNSDFEFVQKIQSPDGKYSFCLFKRSQFRYNDFIVLKLESKINPESLNYNPDSNNPDVANSSIDLEMTKEVLKNQERRSDFATNPNIKLVDNRFLVFSRGNFYFGLYDLKIEKSVFNEFDPFGVWASQNIWAKKGTYYKGKIPKDEQSDYAIWVEKNIKNKIEKYIEETK